MRVGLHPGMVGHHKTEWWVIMNGMYNKEHFFVFWSNYADKPFR